MDLQNIVLQEYWKPSLCCFSYEVFKLSITFGNTGRVSFEEKLFLLEDKPDSRSVAFMTIDRTREWSTNHGGVVLSVTDLCQGCHVRRRKHIVLTMREKTKKRFNAGLKGLVAGIKPREFKCRKMTQTPGSFLVV